MRLATWNLNHRARPRAIPPWVSVAIRGLEADVVVLTEYVAGPDQHTFLGALRAAGLHHTRLSRDTPKENRVLVAASCPLLDGYIEAPAIAASVPSNFIHVTLPQGVNLVGVRVPDYSREPATRRACWDWLEEVAGGLVAQPSVIIGDLNADPSYSRARCGDRFGRLVAGGWQHALPPEGASFWTPGGHGRRLDHAFVSRHLRVAGAHYVSELDGIILANRRQQGLPDHAALVVDVHDAADRRLLPPVPDRSR